MGNFVLAPTAPVQKVFASEHQEDEIDGADVSPVLKVSASERQKDEKKGSKISNLLSLLIRLSEMSDTASMLGKGDNLAVVGPLLNEELDDIEAELRKIQGPKVDNILNMVAVVRGTLRKYSENLTDEQVADADNNSWTYANPEYWERHYGVGGDTSEPYDWYFAWDEEMEPVELILYNKTKIVVSSLRDVVNMHYLDGKEKSQLDVMMLGCGNADMSEKMYLDGFERIENIDVSEKVIAQMQEKYGNMFPKMKWKTMDASEMEYSNDSFDVVMDKGTFDAIEGNTVLLHKVMREAHRTLRAGGLLMSVTFYTRKVRIGDQLTEGAHVRFKDCSSHTFKPLRRMKKANDNIVYHLHVCEK